MWLSGTVISADIVERHVELIFLVAGKRCFHAVNADSVDDRSLLSDLCMAVGISKLNDSDQLFGKTLDVDVVSFTPVKNRHEYLIAVGFRASAA